MAYDIYLRVSTHAGEASTSPETQEAACRGIAAVKGVVVGEVVYDEGVSGGAAVADRQLEHLIQRCEKKESDGVIVFEVTRFGRDMAEGALAWKRMQLVGARLLSADGVDSDQPGSRLHFNMLMAIADDFLERNKAGWDRSKRGAVERGVHLYQPSFGYRKDASGRLVVEPDEADTVREVYRLRARGMGFSEMSRKLGIGRTTLLKITNNRTYVGETTVPNRRRPGEPDVIKNAHPPIVTEAEWEAANVVKHAPIARRGYQELLALRGLVTCECGRRATGQPRSSGGLSYVTPCRDGSHRASIAATVLERSVQWVLDDAIAEGNPYVTAIIDGDESFERALDAVNAAKNALDEYRDNLDLQKTLGMEDWTEGLKVRRAALDEARRALSEIKPVDRSYPVAQFATMEDAAQEDERRFLRRVIAEIVLRPRGAGGERVRLRWAGSEEWTNVPLIQDSYRRPTVPFAEAA